MSEKQTIDGVFPNPLSPDSIKATDQFGLQVARAIYQSNKAYLEVRNERFQKSRLYFKGKQPIAPYLSLLNVNGKQAFIDINFKPRPIAKKFIKTIIGEYMAKTEKPSVTSVNPIIQDKKQEVVDRAKWKITQGDFINQVQQQSNMQLEDASSYLPSSVDEAEFYYSLNNKQQEELILEMIIQFAMDNNNYKVVKRRLLKDLLLHNVAGVEDFFDSNGRLVFEAIPAEELLYGPSKKEDFSDAPYFGRLKRISISDFRNLSGNNLSEEQIFSVAKSFDNVNSNARVTYPFNQSFTAAMVRPYDSYVIDLMTFWYKTTRNVNYVSGVDKNNRPIFDINDRAEEKTNPNKKKGSKSILVGYTGTWIVGTDFIINWGMEESMLKREDDLANIEAPFSVFMIDNDGDMDSKSIVEDMVSSIMEMDIDILKIQQIKAQQAPNGLIIDINGLEDIDLGLGRGSLNPLELREIRSQQGDIYYRSKNEPGDQNQNIPVKELKSDFGNLLSELINDYNFNLNNIRDYIGFNEYRDGSTVNPKTGFNVIQNQMNSSNNATAYIYDALVEIITRLNRHIGLRIWDALKRKNANGGYKKLLGDVNTRFVEKSDDITASLYDVGIELDLSEKEKADFEQEKQLAMTNGLIDVNGLAAINNIKNFKLASQYLAILTAKNKAEALKTAAANAQANLEANNQSIALKAQAAQAVAMVNAKSQVGAVEAKTQGDLEKEKLRFYNTMREQAFILGKELPDDIKQEIDEYLLGQKQMHAAAAQQMAQEEEQQEQQQAQQAQQEQEQQQVDPMSPTPQQVQAS